MVDRTDEEKDILREVGNIGGGNALTSLSLMLGCPLELDVPDCRIVEREEAGSMLKDPDSLYAGVSMAMTGSFDCVLALLMSKEFTKLVIDTLDVDESGFDALALSDMQKSALCEVGNIMGNSYVTALGSLFDIRIDVSVPHIVVDAGNRVLKRFLDGHASQFKRLLFVNSAFRTKDRMLESYILLCPTDESLSAMLGKLGM